ncbi:branched-chain amino acid ABC transporter substrate-binding protein [Pseudorhodoferax aquiterrae]|uniref:Branched-chain amino acid ABC transporter substrate-binding protein n=1 Tax=Pseudorhodoferax aquiterrae TaxID=747304 RepID=A0ABQ3FUD7_9BURK|nr:ABC transporter substrate-binding protein [Pseudorhodoferax aquiterrae]GHC68532.1 branched-chain amino acid ABC transporter substrate-binding protein [Pseudorhodoferax aquiterrae]
MPVVHRFAKLAVAGAIAGSLWAGATAYAQDIKIGYTADQSASGVAELGIAGRWGFEAAIEDINKAGGIMGRKVVGVIRDDQGTPPKAIQNMTELIDAEKVHAVVGPANSGNALAWLHLPQQKKIPVVVPIGTATEITTRYAKEPQNYLFRVSMVDREQVALLGAYAVKASKDRKIAILADSTGYGQGGIKDATDILALHGVTPVATEKYGPKDTDITSQLSKIKAAGADTVIIYGIADGTAQVLRSMEKINYMPLTLGTWGNLSSLLPKMAGGKLAEHLILAASTTEDTNAKTKALGERVRKNFPTLTTFPCSAQAYDSVMLLAAAMKLAGSTDGEKVAAALENVTGVEGVIKTYNKPFSKTAHEGLSVSDFYLARWKGDSPVRYEDQFTKALTPADLKK